MTNRSGTVTLAPGVYPILVAGYEGGGGAGFQASYSGPDTGDTRVIIPSSVLGTGQTGSGAFAYDPAGNFESLNVGDTATTTFTYIPSNADGATAKVALNAATARFDSLTDNDDGAGGFGTGGAPHDQGLVFQVSFTPAAGDLDSSTAAVNLVEAVVTHDACNVSPEITAVPLRYGLPNAPPNPCNLLVRVEAVSKENTPEPQAAVERFHQAFEGR